ncbi:hypothetical protein QBZ16_002852 [Prototheca wickerhamii]|uniref:UBX domain-containing protein n=1 Tax=Prototheca wickerhamii TaxID=3111 RepID=A0AAD9IIN7_PROWI|nr:hypothetical protein QBZ16_002852 [Prototheca wickerhamii]
MGDDFYLRYYVGHKGKFGHEFLEFEVQPDGKLRYANNSNYKNDTMIRKEVYVTQPVLDELKRIVQDSEILKEDDSNWPEPDRVGRQELEIVVGKEHISFATTKLGSLLQVQSSKDPEGLRVFYYLVQRRAARNARPIIDDDSEVDLATSSSEEEADDAGVRHGPYLPWTVPGAVTARPAPGADPTGFPTDIAAEAGLTGVDLEEQKMLLAAYTGEAYEGRRAAPPAELSPRAPRWRPTGPKADAAAREAAERDRAEAERERAARERERDLDGKAARLPPEPADGGVRLMVRLPDGARVGRRFDPADAASALLDFVDVACRDRPDAPAPGAYRLVAQFPRRVLEPGASGSLADAGFAAGQDVLLLETLT